jgi:hypothetical protein
MKKIALTLVLACSAIFLNAQSDSYKMLRSHFADQPEVRSFKLSGMMCRIIVNIIEHDDERLAAALEDVRHVRLMTIPKKEFDAQGLTVAGFKSKLPRDNYELVGDFRDKDGSVAFFHKTDKKSNDLYFVVVEEDDEVIAIEMKGSIDPAIVASDSDLSPL